MRSKQKVLILLGVVAVAAVVSYRFIRSTHQTDPTAIRVSGNIEVTDVDVSFKIPGRLEERAVSEGETVTAGQLVARLDRSELMEEVAVRRAEVDTAQAALAELVAGSRPEEIREAEAAGRIQAARHRGASGDGGAGESRCGPAGGGVHAAEDPLQE